MRRLPLLLLVSCAGAPPTSEEAWRFLERFPREIGDLPAGPEALEAAVQAVTPEGAWRAHRELQRFARQTSDLDALELRFREFEKSFEGPIVELAALEVAVDARRLGATPMNAFLMSPWNRTPAMPRFVALQIAALSWVERAGEIDRYEEAADALDGELARELKEYVAATHEFSGADADEPVIPARLHSAAWALVVLCPGTVLASAAWCDFIQTCASRHRPATALQALDAWERAFGRAEFGSEALCVMAWFADEPQPLIERALRDYPDGRAVPDLQVQLAGLHLEAGREEAMLRTAELVLRRPLPRQFPSQRFRLSTAQANVRKMLGGHFESTGAWSRALEAWEEWRPASCCGPGVAGMTRNKAYHIAICREALGRIDDALELYWGLVEETGDEAMDAARRLRAINMKRGTMNEFRSKAQAVVDKLGRERASRLDERAAARILAEDP